MRLLYSIREYLKLDSATKRQNVDRALDDLGRLLVENENPGPDDWHRVRVELASTFVWSCVLTGGVYALIGLLARRG